MFFPYRARITLFHTPVITRPGKRAVLRTIHGAVQQSALTALKWLGGTDEPWLCAQLMLRLYHARDEKAQLSTLTENPAYTNIAGALASHYEEALFDNK